MRVLMMKRRLGTRVAQLLRRRQAPSSSSFFFQKFFNSRQQEMKGGPTVGKKLSLSQTGSCRLISPTHHHPFYLFFFSFLLFYQTTHLHHRIVFCYYNFWRRFCRRQEFQLSTRLVSSHAANPATGPIPFFFVILRICTIEKQQTEFQQMSRHSVSHGCCQECARILRLMASTCRRAGPGRSVG